MHCAICIGLTDLAGLPETKSKSITSMPVKNKNSDKYAKMLPETRKLMQVREYLCATLGPAQEAVMLPQAAVPCAKDWRQVRAAARVHDLTHVHRPREGLAE